MSNTSIDKFAEYPYYTCETQHNDNRGLGRGQWHDETNSGKGMPDTYDGSGYAKGYSSYANNNPSHYRYVNIKR